MSTASKTLIDLETKFWQSMVDQDTDAALELLNEPALMVSSHGAMQFDHAGYRQMAEKGTSVLKDFKLGKVDVLFANDTTAILSYHVTQKVAERHQNDTKVQEMNETSTWINTGARWQCVAHTETPAS